MSLPLESPSSLAQLLAEHQVHEHFVALITASGFTSVADFAWGFHVISDLDALLAQLSDEQTADLGPDPPRSVHMARMRRCLDTAHTLMRASAPASACASAASALASQPNTWAEHLPPRLTPESVQQMQDTFRVNYPGELLDQDSMPSIRLLSLVHFSLKPGQRLKWVPWQYRLSARQYQESIEAKSSKPIRTEAQILASAFFDDTPEMPVEHMRLSTAWLERIQQVFRNAWALCGAAHLANLKAFDKRVRELCFASPDPALGLRTPNTAELLAADKKMWQVISDLVAQNWTLDDALHEVTVMRGDLRSLLQLRPRPPQQPLPPKKPTLPSPQKRKAPDMPAQPDKGDKEKRPKGRGKGKGEAQGPPQNWASSFKGKPICRRFQSNACRLPDCKYAHVCAIKGCHKDHSASDHSKPKA